MDINQEEGQKIANNLKDVLFIAGDTKNKEDIKNAVARALEKFGNFDVISLNAGIHRCNTILDISDEELDLIIQNQYLWLCKHHEDRHSSYDSLELTNGQAPFLMYIIKNVFKQKQCEKLNSLIYKNYYKNYYRGVKKSVKCLFYRCFTK